MSGAKIETSAEWRDAAEEEISILDKLPDYAECKIISIHIRIEGATMRERFGVDTDGVYEITEGKIQLLSIFFSK